MSDYRKGYVKFNGRRLRGELNRFAVLVFEVAPSSFWCEAPGNWIRLFANDQSEFQGAIA